jgi:hypothetical protein
MWNVGGDNHETFDGASIIQFTEAKKKEDSKLF